jgi:hypothetical protein
MNKGTLIRLMQEIKALAGKNEQLAAYLGNDFNRHEVSPKHWELLERQQIVMGEYQEILEDRLIDALINTTFNWEELK